MRKEILKSIDQFKTIKKEEVEQTNFITIESYLCYLNNGEKIHREKILKNGKDGSAVIVFPVTEDGKIILAIEPRVFTKRTVGVGLPAGYIEEGEDHLTAAKRELLEETGYMSNEFIHVGSFYQDQGCSGALNHYYLAFDCIKVSEQDLDSSEFIEYVLVTEDELNELLSNGYITGLNSAYLIEKGKSYVRR